MFGAEPARGRRLVLVTGVVLLIASLAGCAAITPDSPTGDGSTVPDFNATERHDDLRGFNATVSLHAERPGGTEDRRYRLVARTDPRKYRQTFLAPESKAGNVRVWNRSMLWRYNATTNTVHRRQVASVGSAVDYGAYVDRIFAAIARNRTEGGPPPTVGVAPLPAMPSGDAPGGNSSVGTYLASYHGTDTVDGRQTYVVRLRPRDPDSKAAFIRNRTLWLDAEYVLPLRERLTVRTDNGTADYTVTYRNVTFNPDLAEEAFRFDPPANATVNTSEGRSVERYDSLATAAEQLPFDPPEPTLPEGFAFEYVRVVQSNTTDGYLAVYENGSSSVFVTRETNTSADGGHTTATVDIGGSEGSYGDAGTVRFVYWNCGGYRYSVAGSVPRGELLTIARSIACE